jgi:cation:H+ antiporter
VLGITALIADIPVAPGAVSFDIPIMFAVALACLPIFFTGHRIARWEGGLFLLYGVAYTAYLVATATEHDQLTSFTEAAAGVVVPLTALTLIVIAWRERRSRRQRPGVV